MNFLSVSNIPFGIMVVIISTSIVVCFMLHIKGQIAHSAAALSDARCILYYHARCRNEVVSQPLNLYIGEDISTALTTITESIVKMIGSQSSYMLKGKIYTTEFTLPIIIGGVQNDVGIVLRIRMHRTNSIISQKDDDIQYYVLVEAGSRKYVVMFDDLLAMMADITPGGCEERRDMSEVISEIFDSSGIKRQPFSKITYYNCQTGRLEDIAVVYDEDYSYKTEIAEVR